MKILALETSTDVASLALQLDGEVRSITLTNPPAHSATVLPALHRLLDEADTTLTSLDVIACGIGPGSFTGVRLACSIAQGLALGAGLPVAPVNSLLALAQGQAARRVYCVMDARMREVYVAAYERMDAQWHTVLLPVCVAPDEVPLPPGADWFGAGTGFSAYPTIAERIAAHLAGGTLPTHPMAHAVAELAAQVEWQDAATLAPLYVRDRVALTVAERLAVGGRA